MLSAEEISGYRQLVEELALIHKYTRSAVSAGTVDSWKQAPPVYGTPVVDVECNYLSEGSIALQDGDQTIVASPTLMVSSTDTIKVGDKVTNIKDSANTVVHTGPLYVEAIAVAMGFGSVTNYIATLTGQSPAAW